MVSRNSIGIPMEASTRAEDPTDCLMTGIDRPYGQVSILSFCLLGLLRLTDSNLGPQDIDWESKYKSSQRVRDWYHSKELKIVGYVLYPPLLSRLLLPCSDLTRFPSLPPFPLRDATGAVLRFVLPDLYNRLDAVRREVEAMEPPQEEKKPKSPPFKFAFDVFAHVCLNQPKTDGSFKSKAHIDGRNGLFSMCTIGPFASGTFAFSSLALLLLATDADSRSRVLYSCA